MQSEKHCFVAGLVKKNLQLSFLLAFIFFFVSYIAFSAVRHVLLLIIRGYITTSGVLFSSKLKIFIGVLVCSIVCKICLMVIVKAKESFKLLSSREEK